MKKSQRELAMSVAQSLMPEDEFEKLNQIEINDLGFGYDQFGMEREAAIFAFAIARYVYKYYFRTQSDGHENIPLEKRALIVPNHSGVLPIDAAMVAIDIAYKLSKPRILRTVVDNFAGFLPFINVFFYRVGQVIGARRNFQDLLEKDELVGVFPEGARGTGKFWRQRYQLVKFNVGFIELSLAYHTPIIPTAIIGPEEQSPMIFNIKPLARLVGFPYVPITANMLLMGPFGILPLPVKYRITYGKPLKFYEEYGPEALKDPEIVRRLADKVQLTIQEMIDQGLERRASIFGFWEG